MNRETAIKAVVYQENFLETHKKTRKNHTTARNHFLKQLDTLTPQQRDAVLEFSQAQVDMYFEMLCDLIEKVDEKDLELIYPADL